MSSPSSRYNSNDSKDFGEHFTRSRPRSRTMSMLTVSSSTTFRSAFEITKTLSPLPTVCSRPDVGQAYGSFIPVRSAAKCLRDFAGDFAGDHTTTIPRTVKKRRRVTFQETSSPLSSDDDSFQHPTPYLTQKRVTFQETSSPVSSDDDDQPPISYLSRPFPTQKRGYQSPVMASPPMANKTPHRSPSSTHPILAKLERESRLCNQTDCSTCGKSGFDYPRCSGGCGVMWCSRSCRLASGKRHRDICTPRRIR